MHSRSWIICIVAMFIAATGCDSKKPVQGIVKLDGEPVGNATLTFVSEVGSDTYMGVSDSKGEFTITSADGKPGIKAGTYRIVVVKYESSGEALKMDPTDPTAIKKMETESKGDPKTKGFVGPPGAPKSSSGRIPKSQLPTVYATADSTPLKGIKIPPDTQPFVVELKSK